jgi:YVTN family beta-propeller protein
LQVWDLNAFVRPPTPTTVSLTSLDQAPVGQRSVVLGLAADEQYLYAARYHQALDDPHSSDQPGVLVILNQQTLQPVPQLPQFPGFPPGIPVGFQPRSVAVNPVTRKIYVTNYSQKSYSLTVIDGNTLKVKKTISLGQVPTYVAVNSKTNRVYVSNLFQRLIHVVDGATDEVIEPIMIGPGAQGLAVDETTNTLYVALMNRSFQPFVNGLGVVIDDPQHREILPIVPIGPIGIDAQDVAVDPEHDRIYVSNQGNVGAGPPNVTVIHRQTLSVLKTIPLPGAVRQIALNSDAREVYVTTDRGNVQVINTTTLTVDRVIPVSKAPWGIDAVGGTARQVFVGDRSDGTITRLA